MKHTLITSFLIAFALAVFPSQTLIGKAPHAEAAKALLAFECQYLKENVGVKIFKLGGAFNGSINEFTLIVEVPKELAPPDPELSLDPRRMFVILLQHFIDQTNAIEKIRPYLKNYPFTVANFNYRVIFPDFDTLSSLDNPRVALVYNRGNKVVYCYRDNETKKLEPFFSETYEEALDAILDLLCHQEVCQALVSDLK